MISKKTGKYLKWDLNVNDVKDNWSSVGKLHKKKSFKYDLITFISKLFQRKYKIN